MKEAKRRKIVKNVLLCIANEVILMDINTTCPWFTYQPKAPQFVLQMRKENEKNF